MKMKIALYQSQKEIHTVAARPALWGPQFKVSSEGLTTEIDTVTHSGTNRGRCCLTQVYQAVDLSSMPITTDQRAAGQR